MKGKKISTSILAAVMLAGTTAMPVLAAMPDETVVIGEKAFSLSYANDESNIDAIGDLVTESGGKGIYIKFGNEWYDNMTGETMTDLTEIPAVVYTANGTEEVSYEAQDGDEAVKGFQILDISGQSGVKKIKIAFSQAVDTDAVTFEVKKGKAIKAQNSEKLAWNEEKTEAIILLANHKIGEGDYTVKVKGLELEEDTLAFKGEKEKVEEIQITGENTPLILTKDGEGDITKAEVSVGIKVLNQFGEKAGVAKDLNIASTLKYNQTNKEFTLEPAIAKQIQIGQLKDFEYMVTVLDSNSGVNAKAYLKAVKEAIPTEVSLGEVYQMNDKEELVIAENVFAKKAEQTMYVKIEVEDQYGNVFNRDNFKANIFERQGVVYQLTTAADKDAGKNAEYVFNESDEDDKSVYLKLTGTYENANYDETVFFVLGANVENKTIDIVKDTSKVVSDIAINLPEKIVKGEKIEITEFSASDVNGDDLEGKKLYEALKIADTFDTSEVGKIEVEYDQKTEKVSLFWNLEGYTLDSDKETRTILTISISDTNKKYETPTILPVAKIADLRMDSSKARKVLKEADPVIKVSDMVVLDQYDRVMSTEKVAALEAKDELVVEVGQFNDKDVFVPETGIEVEKDGKLIDRKWSVSPNQKSGKTVNYEVNVRTIEKFEMPTVTFKTIKESEVTKIELSDVSSLYGKSDSNKYGKEFIVIGKTAAGEKVALKENEHYKITTSAVVVVDGKVYSDYDGTIKDFGKKDKTGRVNVISLLEGSEADIQVRTITLEHEAPVRTNLLIRNEKEVQYFDYADFTKDDKSSRKVGENADKTDKMEEFAVITTAQIKELLKITDQYGLEERLVSETDGTWADYVNDVDMFVVRNPKGGVQVEGQATKNTKLYVQDEATLEIEAYFGTKSVKFTITVIDSSK